MTALAWLIPLLPFLAFGLIVFFGRRLPGQGAYVPIGALLAAAVFSLLLFSGSPGWAALPPSVLGGAWFILAALRYVRSVGGLDERSSLLVFGGPLLTGLISLAYPLLRPHQIWVGVGAVLAGLFTIAFALGVLLRSWARARDLATVNAVAENLNRSTNIQEAGG